MTIHLDIPDDLAKDLAERATASGSPPEKIAIAALRSFMSVGRQSAEDKRLTETLAPIRKAFKESGMTEDEAVELFEAEKHAMRQGE